MAIKPIGNRILVKLIEAETQKGLIVIPDTAKEKPVEAEVIELGPGKLMENGKRQPFRVKKGDKVLIEKYTGTEIVVDDTEYLIIIEEAILAITKKEN